MSKGPEQPLLDVFLRPIGAQNLGQFWQFSHMNEAGGLLPAVPGGYANVYSSMISTGNPILIFKTGPATATQPKLSGGAIEISAPSGALNTAILLSGGNNISPFAGAIMVPSRPFYVATKFKVTALPGTDGLVWCSGLADQVASAPGTLPVSYITLAVDPLSLVSNFVLMSAAGGAPTYFDTGIAADTAWHDVAIYSLDGLTAFARIDSTTVGPYTYLQSGSDGYTGTGMVTTTGGNLTTVTMRLDEELWIGPVSL